MNFQRWNFSMQFACFNCRKSFKHILGYWRKGNKNHWQETKRAHNCPDCGDEMWQMGSAFKAPKLSDIKQWRKVELLVRSGFVFSNNRGTGLETLADAVAYAREQTPKLLPKKRVKALYKK